MTIGERSKICDGTDVMCSVDMVSIGHTPELIIGDVHLPIGIIHLDTERGYVYAGASPEKFKPYFKQLIRNYSTRQHTEDVELFYHCIFRQKLF